MTKKMFLILIAIVATISCIKAEVEPNNTLLKATTITEGIKFSEGSVIDGNAVLVSNFGTAQLDPMNNQGKGYISKIIGEKSEIFIPADGSLSAPKGMAVIDNHLLIADVGKVVIYNLNDKSKAPQIITMPEGNLFVNDIVVAGKNAYISVTNTGKIFTLDISNIANTSSSKLIEYATIVGANGLTLNGKTMYIASYPADGNTTADNVIYVIENIEKPEPQKLINRQGQYDGIAIDGVKLYFTNWVNNEVGFINLNTKEVTILNIKGAKITGPADISIFKSKLYIPNLPSSEIVIVQL